MVKNSVKVRVCGEKRESESYFFVEIGEKGSIYDQMGKKLIGES
jgi:hypothetical protein